MSWNLRSAERLPILGDLRGEIMVFEPLSVKELGAGGATIETRFALQLNSLHDLRLTLGQKSVVVKGRVVHSHISEVDQEEVAYLSGLEFVAPRTTWSAPSPSTWNRSGRDGPAPERRSRATTACAHAYALSQQETGASRGRMYSR